MGAMGNGRAFEYLLLKMYGSPLKEMQSAAGILHTELGKVIPSFVKRANDDKGKMTQSYMNDADSAVAKIAHELVTAAALKHTSGVELADYEKDADIRLVAHILYSRSHATLAELFALAKTLSQEKRFEIIKAYVGARKNRRHKPGRAFENTSYGFDVLSNFGAYRDIQRHRVLTQERQLLSTRHGFDMPHELHDTGFDVKFKEAMAIADTTFKNMEKTMPREAQYAVPFAYRLRWYMRMNLREAYHLCELRSMQQGHIDYRKIAQEMYKEILKVHPFAHMEFVDMGTYALERLESEKRIDEKLARMKK